MFRCAISAVRTIRPLAVPYFNAARIISHDLSNFTTYKNVAGTFNNTLIQNPLSNNKQILDISSKIMCTPVRSVTKLSLKKGKRKTVKNATRRFFRLHWGGWIRPKVGRHKKLWKKSPPQQRRLRQHVFCNAKQCSMLDKMVTKFWKRPKYYVDDPYAPYHMREEFAYTRKNPVRH